MSTQNWLRESVEKAATQLILNEDGKKLHNFLPHFCMCCFPWRVTGGSHRYQDYLNNTEQDDLLYTIIWNQFSLSSCQPEKSAMTQNCSNLITQAISYSVT